MARPFTYISSNQYYELEIYFFKLTLFIDTEDYNILSTTDKIKIQREIIWLSATLDLMQTFRQIPSNERAVFAMEKIPKGIDTYVRLFRFSSAVVASRCLDINSSHITATCQKKRPSAGGYMFSYMDDIENSKASTVSQPKKRWFEE
jgi:hypothetical protein